MDIIGKEKDSVGAMIRKLDDLGRISLPKELRKSLDVDKGTYVEILIDGDKIVLRRYNPVQVCAVSGVLSDSNVSLLDGKLILSRNSAKELATELKNKFTDKE